MLLKRYLDSDTEADIAFEAEISGFRELARNAVAALMPRRAHGAAAANRS
jgi:SHS2 domain-containing protein